MSQLQLHTTCQLSRQYFKVPVWAELSPTIMHIKGPGLELELQDKVDVRLMRYGGMSASLENLSIKFIKGGCLESDYGNDVSANFVVLSTSILKNCSVWDAAYLAQLKNAFWNAQERKSLMNSRVRTVHWQEHDPLMRIPVLSVSHAVGTVLTSLPNLSISLKTNASLTIATTFNILCDTQEGSDDDIVIIGAHLDGVPAGPGMVDNASGSSAILEVVIQLYKSNVHKHLRNKIRFAWWGAEELGLMGSRHYTRELSKNEEEFRKVAFYVNHDMLGSPNYIPYVQEYFVV